MILTKSIWSLHCTNLNCGYASSSESGEPDVICQRCGGFIEINEHISIIEEHKENNNDDLCGN